MSESRIPKCFTCGADMHYVREEVYTSADLQALPTLSAAERLFAAFRWVCGDWIVHPMFMFGGPTRRYIEWKHRNLNAGAPETGVAR